MNKSAGQSASNAIELLDEEEDDDNDNDGDIHTATMIKCDPRIGHKRKLSDAGDLNESHISQVESPRHKKQQSENDLKEENLQEQTADNIHITEPSSNPFAKFAYLSSSTNPISHPTPFFHNAQNRHSKEQTIISITKSNTKSTTKQAQEDDTPPPKKTKEQTIIPIKHQPPSLRKKIRIKWQSFCHPDASLETKRYQVFVAARLHARAHETVIRSAMRQLFQYFDHPPPSPKDTSPSPMDNKTAAAVAGFTITQISKTSPEELSHIVPNVHFANSKSKQIIQASQSLLNSPKWDGKVPETEEDLKRLVGIGPKLAEILSYVNTREAYNNEFYDEEFVCG